MKIPKFKVQMKVILMIITTIIAVFLIRLLLIGGLVKLLSFDSQRTEVYRTYILSKEEANQNSTEYDGEQKEQLLQYSVDWSEDQILDEIEKRAVYLNRCSYYEEVLDFLENDREVRDISMYINPLYYTDTEYYNEDSFSGVPSLIIHLAKNEIYARHGYIFKDENLKNYFMGQLWYIPSVKAEEFDDSVFSDIEKRNLELLNRLDTYKK